LNQIRDVIFGDPPPQTSCRFIAQSGDFSPRFGWLATYTLLLWRNAFTLNS
jgi:hypothetical protein